MEISEVYRVAREAVERLVHENGLDITFPFDAIWQYASDSVPSLQRPGAVRVLKNEKYIELTGAMTRAISPDRAGSSTPEYRPGSRFRGQTTPSKQNSVAALHQLQQAMEAEGLVITPAELANFYVALLTSPIVILVGLSGTGKSWLPRLFSKLTEIQFRHISVQPQWSDNADLFGYTSSLSPTVFVEGEFTKAVVEARSNIDLPLLVLLDEMNLAAIEHYFSDFLSVVATRRKENGVVVTDTLPLELPIIADPDPYHALRQLALPNNVRVVGTANIDETTRLFSPKVIDRAFVIEFDDVDLTAFPTYNVAQTDRRNIRGLTSKLTNPNLPISPREVYLDSQIFFDWIAGLLEEIRQILRPGGISFAYRTRDAILIYMWHWRYEHLAEIITADAAFDFCILQKILPKISGTGEALREALEKLSEWLEHNRVFESQGLVDVEQSNDLPLGPFRRSAEKTERMLRRLDVEGATTYWGV